MAIPSSWTSKLFFQEIESCNIGIKRIPRPFMFERQDNVEREFSHIDVYNEASLKQLARFAEESIDDGNVAMDEI
jgi:hypothetical protein